MSAYEDLREQLRRSYTPRGDLANMLRADTLIDAALRERVRELVKDAREYVGPLHMPSGLDEPPEAARYVLGWHNALDRIDPEANR